MNEYLRRPERVQAMQWTRESTVELSRWLDECCIGHHFHDEAGDVVSADRDDVVTMCLDAMTSNTTRVDEVGIMPVFWVTYSPKTEKTTVYTDSEFRRRYQVTL